MLNNKTVQAPDPEIKKAVKVYVDDVRIFCTHNAPLVEVKLPVKWGGLSMNVRIDAAGVDLRRRVLRIWDYKHGRVTVDPVENWQMIIGAAALIQNYPEMKFEEYDIELAIVQPRADGPDIKTWGFNGQLIRNYMNQAENSFTTAYLPNPPARTGPHCAWCRALTVCHSRKRAISLCLDVAERGQNLELTPEQAGMDLAILHEAQKRLKENIMALEGMVFNLMKTGTPVKGWNVATGRGSTIWKDTPENIGTMLKMMGHDITKAAVKTPKQALDAGVPGHIVKQMSIDKPGAMKLTPDTTIDNKAKELINNVRIHNARGAVSPGGPVGTPNKE